MVKSVMLVDEQHFLVDLVSERKKTNKKDK